MGGCANQAVLFIVVLIEGEYKRRSIIVLARKVILLRTPIAVRESYAKLGPWVPIPSIYSLRLGKPGRPLGWDVRSVRRWR